MFHYAILHALGPEELFKLMRVTPDGGAPPRPPKARNADERNWGLPLIEAARLPQGR